MHKNQNICWSQSLLSAIIQKPMEKSYGVFVKGIRVMWISGLAYKNTSVQHSSATITTVTARALPVKHTQA